LLVIAFPAQPFFSGFDAALTKIDGSAVDEVGSFCLIACYQKY
jgi:hypothetical protein